MALLWLQVLRLGDYTPSLCIAGSPSLQHVDFKCLRLMLHLFPKLDLASCPEMRLVTVHSMDFTTPEDDAIEVGTCPYGTCSAKCAHAGFSLDPVPSALVTSSFATGSDVGKSSWLLISS
eukprot:scaffold189404_cov18-Tisochrysis_lutea.AAC.4